MLKRSKGSVNRDLYFCNIQFRQIAKKNSGDINRQHSRSSQLPSGVKYRRRKETNSMFCPGCGAENQTAKAYCKRCGEWLPEFKQRRSRRAFGGETPQQSIFTSLFMSALSAAVALFSAIALYATYLGTGQAKWSIYLAGAFCLCITGWQASSFAMGLKLRNRLNRAREGVRTDSLLDQGTVATPLPPADMSNFVSAQSVTENTTELLQPANRPQSNDSQRRKS